ncbi:hypothetical protein KI387_002555, partial [Taxus chinensis]
MAFILPTYPSFCSTKSFTLLPSNISFPNSLSGFKPHKPYKHKGTFLVHKTSGRIRAGNELNTNVELTEDLGLDQTPAEKKREGSNLQTLLNRFWKVATPYWTSDDKVQARLRLASVFALTLATTGISVGFNFLGRDFYNALASKDQEQFTKQLLYYLGAFAGGIPVFVLRDYGRETLALRWRAWMTNYYLDRYFGNRTFYKIQSQSLIDNPDQRIVDDVSSFTGTALSFSLTLFTAAVDLISFSNILFGIYPPLFVVLIVYSLGGTAISVLVGKGLVTLNFMQEKKEADFRYGLVRIRENAESIAFYGGEGNEMQLLLQRFNEAFENLAQLLLSSRNLEFFTNGYRYLIQILPAAVVAPMYFSGKIEFGVINQSYSAFNHILGDFSLIVYQFQAISAFSAVIDRLGEFSDILDQSNSQVIEDSKPQINILKSGMDYSGTSGSESNGAATFQVLPQILEIENLTLQTPQYSMTLIEDLSLVVNKGDHLLIMGPSGSGKTSLLRAIAGLWSSGKGTIKFHIKQNKRELLRPIPGEVADSNQLVNEAKLQAEDLDSTSGRLESVIFLPQRPYMVLGTLRQQLLYPTWIEDLMSVSESSKSKASLPFLLRNLGSINSGYEFKPVPNEDELVRVLTLVRLGHLMKRCDGLDSRVDWSSVLSLGEQQRLAFARLLLARPELALLDESTSALDEANETHLYKEIKAAGITYISVGHRSTLPSFHRQILRLESPRSPSYGRNWILEPVDQYVLGLTKSLV